MHIRLLYKKVLCVFMSLMIVIFSTQSAYATTSLGGWTALDTITAGATNTINAVKGAGSSAVKSAITIAPSVANVGKHLIKGGGAAALAFAMVELGEGAIDWVLDPANNAIKYTVPAVPAVPLGANTVCQYKHYQDGWLDKTASDICRSHVSSSFVQISSGQIYCSSGSLSKTIAVCPLSGSPYVPATDNFIPIADVAAQVVSNAEAGHADSQEALKAVALEGFAAGEHDAALDAAAVPDTGVENPPDTTNPDAPAEPVPFDPSSIIAAIAGLKAMLAGILSSITGFVDWWEAQWTTFSTAITGFTTWVRAEPDTATLQPEPVEVTEGTLVAGWEDKVNAGYVNLGSTQCPADVLIPISYMGASTNLSISYVPFCHFASIIRYAVILGAWVAALMIISGGRTRE